MKRWLTNTEYSSLFLYLVLNKHTRIKWLFCACRTISVSTQVQGGDFNLYEGVRCHGVPLVTISRGRLVCENGVFMCAEGSGKFYPQRTFPDYLYKKMVQREKVRSLSFIHICVSTESKYVTKSFSTPKLMLCCAV